MGSTYLTTSTIIALFLAASCSVLVSGTEQIKSSSDAIGALGGSALRETTLFSVIREFARNRPELSREVINKLINLIPDEDQRSHQMEIVERAFVDTMEINGPPCTTCKVLIQAVRIVLELNGYDSLVRNVMEICDLIFTAIDPTQENNAKETCNTVYYQLPHIAAILLTMNSATDRQNRSSADDICRTLNACYEPPENVLMEPHVTAELSVSENAKSKNTPIAKERIDTKQATRAPIKIAQISDVHLELGYAEDTNEDCPLLVCCLEKQGPGNAKPFGSYSCNIPVRTLNLFLDKVISLDPDMIIFSGDVPPHKVWDETLQSQLDHTEALTNSLLERLSTYTDLFVYPSIGNHEMYPTNLFSIKHIPDETLTMVKRFGEIWNDLANFTAEQISTMMSGGYYTILSRYNNIRILSINTDYLYSFNFYNVLNHRLSRAALPSTYEANNMQIKVEEILTKAQNDGEKVIIINHHPPGGGDYIIHASRWYESLIVRFTDVIILQVAGHTHTDEFRLIKDDQNNVKSMVYVNPSVDMHGMTNPSVRLYTLDDIGAGYEVLNYEQYYFDLSQSATSTPEITKLYDAQTAYQLANLQPASWEMLLKRFETDQNLLLKHRRYSDADAGTPPTSCEESCRRNHVCRQLHANYDHYEVCAAGPPQPTTTVITPSTTWPPLVRPDGSAPPLNQKYLPLMLAMLLVLAVVQNMK